MNVKEKVGVIYILTNPSFPKYVKIGYAQNIKKWLEQLNKSQCTPYPFSVYAVYEVNQPPDSEYWNRIIGGKKLPNDFYEMSAEDVYLALKNIVSVIGTLENLHRFTPEGHEILDEEKTVEEPLESKERRKPFSFIKCGIPIGSTLSFVGNPEIIVTVVDERHISYQNQITSVSALARFLKGFDHNVQGTLWFTYNGKRLTEIREEVEKK